MERKKLELELNKPTNIEMLFDQCHTGESQYGKYYLFAVLVLGEEFSFFAPEEVHSRLSELVRGDSAVVTKRAVQKGSKVLTSYEVELAPAQHQTDHPSLLKERATPDKQTSNIYLDAMIASFEDALVIQERFNGMANVNQIAVTLFIQRTKTGGY